MCDISTGEKITVTSQRMYNKAPPHNPQVFTMSEIDLRDFNCMKQYFEAAPPRLRDVR
ncbi:hypothetical protein J6590_050306 [Homalodisca vitripennis]|nr:hypothetical protein J6590_050306 [Homalodisca vitripennis]